MKRSLSLLVLLAALCVCLSIAPAALAAGSGNAPTDWLVARYNALVKAQGSPNVKPLIYLYGDEESALLGDENVNSYSVTYSDGAITEISILCLDNPPAFAEAAPIIVRTFCELGGADAAAVENAVESLSKEIADAAEKATGDEIYFGDDTDIGGCVTFNMSLISDLITVNFTYTNPVTEAAVSSLPAPDAI